MKTIRNAFLIGLTFAAISLAAAEDTAGIKKDMDQLQGEWSMVSGTADGQPMPDEMRKQMKRVCKGDEITVTTGGQLFLKAKFAIDPSKKPKTIDYEMIDGFTKGKKQLGIYELDGDTFKSCFGAPGADRPRDFTSEPGDMRTSSVWKREGKQTAASVTNAPSQRGGRGTPNSNDVFYALGPDSKPRDGVPKGKYTEAKTLPSNVFPGTQHTYWVYVPAQYDPTQPTAVMIFNDGQAMKAEPGDVQAHHVLDNLIFRREIPVMLGVFINPGRRPDQPEPSPRDWGDRNTNRPDEYNHPNDKYARVIVEELMPALKKEYNISPDPELHGIMGASSGGIAAFSTAWFRPDDFRKVISFVGSFTDIRGGYVFPELVAESEKKPIRIFMQDGRNDNRRPGRPNNDWFLQNVRLAQALTKKGYDLNYTWGIGNHGQKQGGAIFPEMMRWLWRDLPVSTDPNDTVERSFRFPGPESKSQFPNGSKD